MFFFAWVDADQTTFGPGMEVVDEDVFSFAIGHEEGQIPTLDLTIKNPRVGLLAPGRKVWAWLSYAAPGESGALPLFFGVLVGVPTNLFAELVTLKFVAKAADYIVRKQVAAEAMKVRPYYDPVWLDDRHRDDPDSILEGWSALWHVDRLTLVVTASDVLLGEDGTVNFTGDDAFYDSVALTLDQPPLSSVQVEATVNWTQCAIGYVDIAPPSFVSYTGETLISEWPKPRAGLGGGWSVESSAAIDSFDVSHTPTVTYSSSWSDKSGVTPENGQPTSITISMSYPALLSPDPLTCINILASQVGIVDPTSDPPINQPAKIDESGIVIPQWFISTELVLRYDADRKRSESLFFLMTADTQGLLTAPTVEQDTELISITGTDVGAPLLDVLAWTDFIGRPVPLGQLIFPNDPTLPGGLSYQVCVQAGTASASLPEPAFSDVVGATTADGTVVWASLGQSPLLTQPDWASASPVPLGEIICPTAYVPLSWQELVNPDFSPFKTVGAQVSRGQIVGGPGAYMICTNPGTTGLHNPGIPGYGATVVDGMIVDGRLSTDAVTWTGIGAGPNGAFFYICTGAGVTNVLVPPDYTFSAGASFSDGSVQWTCLANALSQLGIPIGGTPGNVTARSYFPTDRGLWSVEYLIAKARARLRLRARAVKVAWDCPFGLATTLSCRMNATLSDPRLPGGTATGKIVAYALHADGDGKMYGHVEIGCAIGFGDSIAPEDGTPEYCDTDYVDPGYQVYDGQVTALTGSDVGYTPPAFAVDDDGLTFPLTKAQAVAREQVHGSASEQAIAITAAFPATRNLATVAETVAAPVTPGNAWNLANIEITLATQAVPAAMEANPVWYELDLNPVVNGPFASEYAITVTPLKIPRQINLQAPSAP